MMHIIFFVSFLSFNLLLIDFILEGSVQMNSYNNFTYFEIITLTVMMIIKTDCYWKGTETLERMGDVGTSPNHFFADNVKL